MASWRISARSYGQSKDRRGVRSPRSRNGKEGWAGVGWRGEAQGRVEGSREGSKPRGNVGPQRGRPWSRLATTWRGAGRTLQAGQTESGAVHLLGGAPETQVRLSVTAPTSGVGVKVVARVWPTANGVSRYTITSIMAMMASGGLKGDAPVLAEQPSGPGVGVTDCAGEGWGGVVGRLGSAGSAVPLFSRRRWGAGGHSARRCSQGRVGRSGGGGGGILGQGGAWELQEVCILEAAGGRVRGPSGEGPSGPEDSRRKAGVSQGLPQSCRALEGNPGGERGCW